MSKNFKANQMSRKQHKKSGSKQRSGSSLRKKKRKGKRGEGETRIMMIAPIVYVSKEEAWYKEMQWFCHEHRTPYDYGHFHYLHCGRDSEYITFKLEDFIPNCDKSKMVFRSETTLEGETEETIAVIQLSSEYKAKEAMCELENEEKLEFLLVPKVDERYQDYQGRWIIPMESRYPYR